MTVAVGCTGTRDGMTLPQQCTVQLTVLQLGATELHHGDCVGADDQFDQIAVELGLDIYVHPPSNPRLRAWCNTRPHEARWILPMKPYLTRNKDIVRATAALIAAPKEMTDGRSGTWVTVRFALGTKPVWIAWPDGSLEFRGILAA